MPLSRNKTKNEALQNSCKCRYCGKAVESGSRQWNAYQPFCSERCRLADLDCWFEGEYRIPGGPLEDEEDLPYGES